MSVEYALVDFGKPDFVDQVTELVKRKASFKVTNVPAFKQGKARMVVEDIIDANKMRSRVYTNGRSFTGIGNIIAVVHDICTLAPDYEIRKDFFDTGLTVTHWDDQSVLEKF